MIMADVFFPGQLVILNELSVPVDVSSIPIWNVVYDSLIDPKDYSYAQVDYISFRDVAMVINEPVKDGSVLVLTNRGLLGFAWTGHLRVIANV